MWIVIRKKPHRHRCAALGCNNHLLTAHQVPGAGPPVGGFVWSSPAGRVRGPGVASRYTAGVTDPEPPSTAVYTVMAAFTRFCDAGCFCCAVSEAQVYSDLNLLGVLSGPCSPEPPGPEGHVPERRVGRSFLCEYFLPCEDYHRLLPYVLEMGAGLYCTSNVSVTRDLGRNGTPCTLCLPSTVCPQRLLWPGSAHSSVVGVLRVVGAPMCLRGRVPLASVGWGFE